MKDWRLYGMWCVLDVILALFLFALAPIFLNVYIAQGIFFYFQMFIATIAGLLLIATFLAFHKGSMVNIQHRVIKGAADWWEWIVFHWAMVVLLSALTAFLMLITLPVIENSATPLNIIMYGIGMGGLYSFFLVHFASVWQYFYLKRKSIMPAFFETVQKFMGRTLRQNLAWLLFPQIALLVCMLLIESLVGIFFPVQYEQIDSRLVRAYHFMAPIVIYISIMRNRKVLFG